MSPTTRTRHRMNVILQMVTTLVCVVLLGQLWLFTTALDAIEGSGSPGMPIIAAICSLLACAVIWMLIRFFLRTEREEVKE